MPDRIEQHDHATREVVLGWLSELKAKTQDLPEFGGDKVIGRFYLALLTLEGAILFGDDAEFAEVCLAHCQRKLDEMENFEGE